ncbi:MAG: restriction endonuclease subunit S [Aquabacterium sp.]|nr:restriction endonuclease subunit S [Aquabacterium sp.]
MTEKAENKTNPIALENIESWSGRFVASGSDFEGDGVRFVPGDILFGKLRPYLAKVLLAPWPGEAVGDFHVLRPRTGVFARFAQYVMLTRAFIDMVDGSTFGSKMPRASWEFVGNMALPLPSYDEQTLIAAFLDRETAKIDALVAEQERLIALLKEKRQAVISHAVTKGLDPSVPMKDSGVEWLGQVPAHWRVMPIRLAARLESGHTPSRSRPDWWVDCNIPWFSLADVWQIREAGRDVIFETKEHVSELGLANSSARLLPKGTVMLSRTASVGFAAIMGVDMATTQDFANWVCGEELLPEFLLAVFKAMKPEFQRLMMGSTHNTIYMPDIQAFRFALPSLDDQRAVVAHLSERLQAMDKLIDEAVRSIELLQERRSALISAAVTGQIDVRGLVNQQAAA